MADFLSRIRGGDGNRPADQIDINPPGDSGNAPPVTIVRLPDQAAPDAPKSVEANDDLAGIGPAIRRLAEFVVHAGTQTPLGVGILGASGAGKSYALNRLLADIDAIAEAAQRQASPAWLGRIVAARIDASGKGDPATRIASAIFEALQRPSAGGKSYPALAEEAADAITDPAEAARLARERLADARRRLDSEREALREMHGRRSRLAENVLYEAAGSRIDAHARSKRSAIESRLRAFGFTTGDPIATYKDLVRDIAENSGFAGRLRAFFRALWAFRGQMRLIVLAIFFFAVAWGIGEAETARATWLGWLNSVDALKRPAAWIEAHISWFDMARQAAIWAGVLALALNVFRALRFVLPIFRGVSLFRADVAARNQDLDGLIANQTRHVDDMIAETESLAERTQEAERRAEAAAGRQQTVVKSPFATGLSHQAEAFVGALGSGLSAGGPNAPQRIVVAIDNLDTLSQDAASEFVGQVHSLLSHPNFVTVVAADGDPLASLSLRGQIARLVQIPLRLPPLANEKFAGFVRSALGHAKAIAQKPADIDLARSSLDQPIRAIEADLLTALAPIAGTSPRDVQRFVGVYKLVRGESEDFGALAAALALQFGGRGEEHEALDEAIDAASGDAQLPPSKSERVNYAVEAAGKAQQKPVTADQMRQARHIVARWSYI